MASDCSMDDCVRPAVARTWCRAHWKLWRRNGVPLKQDFPHHRKAPATRFWPKVAKGADDACWEWQASRDPLGYGFFRMTPGEVMWRAHRAAWVLTRGPVPHGMLVCHRCDNPPCVNPGHLFLGSNLENQQDKVAKGRSSHSPPHWGERSPGVKVTTAQVLEIRSRYARGDISQRALGDIYGVGQVQISRIVRGTRRKYETSRTTT